MALPFPCLWLPFPTFAGFFSSSSPAAAALASFFSPFFGPWNRTAALTPPRPGPRHQHLHLHHHVVQHERPRLHRHLARGAGEAGRRKPVWDAESHPIGGDNREWCNILHRGFHFILAISKSQGPKKAPVGSSDGVVIRKLNL